MAGPKEACSKGKAPSTFHMTLSSPFQASSLALHLRVALSLGGGGSSSWMLSRTLPCASLTLPSSFLSSSSLLIASSRISAGCQVLQHGCHVPGDTCTHTLQAAALAQQWVHTPHRELQAAGMRQPRLGLGTSLGTRVLVCFSSSQIAIHLQGGAQGRRNASRDQPGPFTTGPALSLLS